MSTADAIPASTVTTRGASSVRIKLSRDDYALRTGIVVVIILLAILVVLPLYSLLSKSLEDMDGNFVGLQNFHEYFQTPALLTSITNSLSVAFFSAIIVLVLAFIYAYALTRTQMPFRLFFRGVALIPILAPSLLAAISLIYWFGTQGVLKSWLFGASIYGPIGVIMASCFWVFPHALMILITALSTADA
ncbi:MAG: putative 2-aminoethylphosphonate ABC transporter permease subunit, partial [SAR324 cluster bacterium]|nr:putative 2-aminoethylphosphonate ABC transporter permease subunit [SAR324 cluster bacterium]